jgi:hypothetical protein
MAPLIVGDLSIFPRRARGHSSSDAKVPLRMTWFAGSYLDLPVYK